MLKPERDSSVAQRMIGAALGVRVNKSKPVKSSSASATSDGMGAWDD